MVRLQKNVKGFDSFLKCQTEYTKDDIKKMAALGEDNYGSQNSISDVGFLEWQLLENPTGKGLVSLAVNGEDGKLIGESMQTPMKLRAFSEEVTATTFVNTLIRKESRSLAVFYTIHKTALDLASGHAFAYAVPNPNSYPLFGKLYDFKTIGDIPLLILPMRAKAIVKSRIGKGFSMIIPNIAYKGFGGKKHKNITVSKLSEDDFSEFDTFWNSVKDKYPIMGVRNAEYINWRYLTAPLRDYTVFIAKDKDKIVGYTAVTTQLVEDIKNGMLVDFLVEHGRKDAAKALLRYTCDYFYQNNSELIGTLMLPTCEEYKYIKKFGFLVCPKKFLPQPFSFIIKMLSGKNAEKTEDISNWFFTMGDYDAV